MSESPKNLIAIDIGNSRVKLGWFPAADSDCVASALGKALPIAAPRLVEPAATLAGTVEELVEGRLAEWTSKCVGKASAARAVVASVSQPAEHQLSPLLGVFHSVDRLASNSLPIELRVDEPEKIGVDRVIAAVAVNQIRAVDKPAIVVDVGTAITVDLVSPDGALEGGAILPGPGLSARALGEKTDALPEISFGDLEDSPDAVGRSTVPAIRAGIFWGAVGAIRELIARQRDRLTVAPQVFLTGGAAPSIARLIGGPDFLVRCLPHLTLSGIAVAAQADQAT